MVKVSDGEEGSFGVRELPSPSQLKDQKILEAKQAFLESFRASARELDPLYGDIVEEIAPALANATEAALRKVLE